MRNAVYCFLNLYERSVSLQIRYAITVIHYTEYDFHTKRKLNVKKRERFLGDVQMFVLYFFNSKYCKLYGQLIRMV